MTRCMLTFKNDVESDSFPLAYTNFFYLKPRSIRHKYILKCNFAIKTKDESSRRLKLTSMDVCMLGESGRVFEFYIAASNAASQVIS